MIFVTSCLLILLNHLIMFLIGTCHSQSFGFTIRFLICCFLLALVTDVLTKLLSKLWKDPWSYECEKVGPTCPDPEKSNISMYTISSPGVLMPRQQTKQVIQSGTTVSETCQFSYNLTKKMLVGTYLLSVIIYTVSIWGFLTTTHKKNMQRTTSS